jgi:hypothetical protein
LATQNNTLYDIVRACGRGRLPLWLSTGSTVAQHHGIAGQKHWYGTLEAKRSALDQHDSLLLLLFVVVIGRRRSTARRPEQTQSKRRPVQPGDPALARRSKITCVAPLNAISSNILRILGGGDDALFPERPLDLPAVSTNHRHC